MLKIMCSMVLKQRVKKGAISVPFYNARVPFSTIFAGFPLSVKFQLNTGMEA